MVTAEELREKYFSIETADLFEMATNKISYTELANAVALEELIRRKITKEDIENYKFDASATKYNLHQKLKQNSIIDLELKFKMLYFFILWFPKARKFYNPPFASEGYLLKSNQSNYYSVTGFITYGVFFIYWGTSYPGSVFAALSILVVGFVLFNMVDIYYNRERQIKLITKDIEKDQPPFGYFN